jgi:uncharacterized protein (TIGR00369 family)
MTKSSNAPLPFDELAKAIEARRSVYGFISGLRLDRAAPGEAWSSLPYRPVFVGDTETGVLHGGVVTAMLDESCGMAVQLALDGTRSIATLDLRIDYQKPATPGLDIKAHSFCYRVTRSIAFVRSAAYQESEDDPVATATACFMVGANRTNMLTDERIHNGHLRRSKRRRIRQACLPTARSRAVSVSASARTARLSCRSRQRSSATRCYPPSTAA